MKRTVILIFLIGFLGGACGGSLSLRPDDDGTGASNNDGGGSDDGEDASSPASDESTSTLSPPEFLVINEVYYDDDESDTDGNVFVELVGTTGSELSGYIIRFINGADGQKTDEITFPKGSVIPEDGFFVVADSMTGNSSETNVENADFIDNFDPQNGPDSVQLIDPSGEFVDVVGYGEELPASDSDGNPLYEGSPAMTVDAGKSFSRIAAADTGDNAADFAANEIPSPGNGEVNGTLSSGSTDSTGSDESGEVNDIHFTEVVTDPQQDWSDTTGGDAIAFDSIVGTGTVGTTDEWIEIKNGRDETVDLTLWRLEMLDGTDAAELFSSSSASFVFFDGGDINNFQPDEFLVIGNPSGDLKNEVTLQLFDGSDFLVDELVIDDANASGISDESYQLTDDGNWGMGEATVGF